jgi:hypothetical protein
MSISTTSPGESVGRVEGQMDEETVKRILRLLCRKGAYLTTTRAQKLLYLVERQCVIDNGRRCLWLDYRYDRFGMYSPSLNRLLSNLNRAEDGLEVRIAQTDRGAGRMISCSGVGHGEDLPDEVEHAVAVVIAEYGFLNTPALIDTAKRTSPFVHAKKGDYLDWQLLLEERCHPGEELSDEGKRKLERALKASESEKGSVFESVEELFSYLSQ